MTFPAVRSRKFLVERGGACSSAVGVWSSQACDQSAPATPAICRLLQLQRALMSVVLFAGVNRETFSLSGSIWRSAHMYHEASEEPPASFLLILILQLEKVSQAWSTVWTHLRESLFTRKVRGFFLCIHVYLCTSSYLYWYGYMNIPQNQRKKVFYYYHDT